MQNTNTKKLDSVLKEQGYIIYPIKGISMLPLLVEKVDTVRIERVDKDQELKKYDVVLYYNNSNSYTLHRILDFNKKYYFICGDNCNKLEKVKKNRVIGVMTGYFKKKRFVSVNDSEYLDYVKIHIEGVDYKTRELLYPSVSDEWMAIFSIVKSAITDSEIDRSIVNGDLNWSYIYNLAKRHSIGAIIYSKLDKNIVPLDIYKGFEDIYNNNLKKTILFDNERKRITSFFDKEGIEYVFLKGIIINEMYPKMGLREFADNDILVKDKDTKKIYDFMIGNNYEAASLKGVHDSYHKAPFYNFEFHRALFDRSFKFAKFFNSFIDKANPVNAETKECKLGDEEFYVYNLAHFYKHYSHGGAGIRSFIDTYILRNKFLTKPGFNLQKKDELLDKAGLKEFENEVFSLTDKMFGDVKELDYKDILYIMESGTYGLVSHHVKNMLDDEKGSKFKYVCKRFFIPYRSMKQMYGILTYLPILLPIFWVVRASKVLFNKDSRSHFKTEIEVMKEYEK